MNNFFFDESDYSLFKKALKTTDNEPIVINILSTDSSLQSREDKTAEVVSARKNMSKKYEPSPFGKFFGPRKQQSSSVDMKDFSSWKNKNYRKTEKSLDDRLNTQVKFSLSDFMNDKSSGTFNELDQAKSDLQKPINQLSTSDPLYKRFSLDSYMNKLEEQTLTKDSFEENDDILEPLGTDTQSVVPDSSQDENFGLGSNINIEKFAFDDNTSGDEFKFEQDELDKFRARLDKIEREAANIKEKTNQKVIETNELSELSSGFDIDKLTDDSDDSLADSLDKTADADENSQTPKVKHKTFFEVNKNEGAAKKASRSGLLAAFDTEETDASETDVQEDDLLEALPVDESAETTEEVGTDEIVSPETESDVLTDLDENAKGEINEIGDTDEGKLGDTDVDAYDPLDDLPSGEDFVGTGDTRIKRSDIVTKDDLKSMTDELLVKFTQMSKKQDEPMPVSQDATFDPYAQGVVQDPNVIVGFTDQPYGTQNPYGSENDNLKAQLEELIASNKKLDLEHGQRLKEAELEKERVAAEYESRIKEMEKSFKQSYEDFKKQAYLDKLDRDIKLKEAETKFKKKTAKIKEEEKETYSKEKAGVMLRKELKSNLNISNLEMDKKLLEVASKLNKDNYDKLFAENTEMVRRIEEEAARAQAEELEEPEVAEEIEEIEEVEEEAPKKTTKTRTSTARKSTTRKRTTTRKTTTARKSPRRKIDSDIIGGIDFD